MTTETTQHFVFDYSDDPTMHDPTLYAYDGVVEPLADLAAVDEEAVVRFREDGFLAVERVFDEETVEAARAAITDFVMGRVGSLDNIMFEMTDPDELAAMPIEERELRVRKLMWFCDEDTVLGEMSRDPRLMDVLSRLMGLGEAGSSWENSGGPSLFQDMGLIKPPGGREKPWHQDQAYFDYPVETPVVGVWIALDEATAENGCMRFVPGSHRDGPVIHFKRRDWQICDAAFLQERKPPRLVCPLAPGGAVFFSGLIHHGTPYNATDQRRRALQYHYLPNDAVKESTEYRLGHFGEEGKDVEC